MNEWRMKIEEEWCMNHVISWKTDKEIHLWMFWFSVFLCTRDLPEARRAINLNLFLIIYFFFRPLPFLSSSSTSPSSTVSLVSHLFKKKERKERKERREKCFSTTKCGESRKIGKIEKFENFMNFVISIVILRSSSSSISIIFSLVKAEKAMSDWLAIFCDNFFF